MDIAKLLMNQIDLGSLTGSLSKNMKADKKKVEKAAAVAIPELLAGMNKNVKSEKGLSSLFNAFDDHSSANIKDTNAFLKNVDLADGQKILGHLLGKDNEKVQKKVAKESGLASKDVNSMMSTLAPLLMGFLGGQKKSTKGFDTSTLLTMVGGLAGVGGSSGGGLGSALGSLLGGGGTDTKKSSKKSSKSSKKKQGLDLEDAAGLLGSLFKKK